MTRNFTYLFLAAALAAGIGCGDDSATDGGTDASTGDTGVGDTSVGDTSVGDTGVGDTGVADTGAPDTGVPAPMLCDEACTDDADCTISEMDFGFTCIDGFCSAEPSPVCTDDASCIPTASGWQACESAADCAVPSVQVCVTGGYCAFPSTDAVPCTAPQTAYDTTDVDGGDVTVCANQTNICGDETNGDYDGLCFDPCESDADCPAGIPICDTDTGLCGCTMDAHCAGIPGVSVCVGGTCVCSADADCDDANNADVCMNGTCGCSGTDVCMGDTAFDGTEWTCI